MPTKPGTDPARLKTGLALLAGRFAGPSGGCIIITPARLSGPAQATGAAVQDRTPSRMRWPVRGTR